MLKMEAGGAYSGSKDLPWKVEAYLLQPGRSQSVPHPLLSLGLQHTGPAPWNTLSISSQSQPSGLSLPAHLQTGIGTLFGTSLLGNVFGHFGGFTARSETEPLGPLLSHWHTVPAPSCLLLHLSC